MPFLGANFWQLWQILVTPLSGRDVVRQVVEQNSNDEPFLWYAVCPFIRPFLQCEHDICAAEGWITGRLCVSAVTEKTEPIFKPSCEHQREVSDQQILDEPDQPLSLTLKLSEARRVSHLSSGLILHTCCRRGDQRLFIFLVYGFILHLDQRW